MITKEVKEKFLKEILLDHDMIQESRQDDKLFQGEAALKWQARSAVEWWCSPCREHPNIKLISHGECSVCKRIFMEGLK
jgi:hypothetical protein